ncbi:hypothetical protein RHMOL_Rhmol10G0305000 [Rhododendron molle]|uniref:Uncharacterized protein n=1 Tax=Rhododendron molle TaxID=49168 RepID=A0ACC0M834_RHOML|nr:hypothetical protein RHMOL_Rhmol10G0305000 [Rhododendron molle]
MVQGANWETFFDSGLAVEEALQTGVLTRTEATSSAAAPKAKPRAYTGNSTALFGANNYASAATASNNTATQAPQIEQAWIDQLEAEWEAARADPLDGLSLFMLFYQPEPVVPEEEEYVWDPQPTDAQLAWDQNFHLEPAEAKDDVDEAYLAFYVDGEVIPNERCQLGSFSPLVDKLSEVVRKFYHESDPTDNIVPVKDPRPCVTLEDDCLVMAIDEVPADLWDVDDIVDLNSNPLLEDLWDVDKVMDIQMGNEVWTVNSALVDAGFWDSPFVTNLGVPFEEAAAQDPAFWEGLVLRDLETALRQDSPATVASVDKGKRKMAEIPTDFWDFDDKTTSWWDIANVTRSGRVFSAA